MLSSSLLTKCSLNLASTSLRRLCSSYTNLEKSMNHVTLLGRVGVDPQLKGTATRPVVTFSLATNTNYRMSSADGEEHQPAEIKQKTEWHRISVFKPYLRDSVHNYLKKGSRVVVNGKIAYGEIVDGKGITHQTTTIIAEEVIFVGKKMEAQE